MSQHRHLTRWHPAEVHQAEGMLMVRLHSTIEQAVEALRDYATRTDQPLLHAAREVIGGRATPRPRRNGAR